MTICWLLLPHIRVHRRTAPRASIREDLGASPMQITVGAAQRSLALARHDRRGVVANDLEAPVDRRADDEELVEPFGWRGAHQTLGGGENADVGDASSARAPRVARDAL